MSMWLHSILQCAEVMAAYFAVTLLYPFVFLRGRLSAFPVPARIMACFMAGNIYLQTVVCVLEILHASNRVTLIALLVFPVVFVYRKSIEKIILKIYNIMLRMVNGVLGAKTLLVITSRRTSRRLAKRMPRNLTMAGIAEIWLAVCAVGVVLFFYGSALTECYGYAATDPEIVNSGWRWINADTPTHSSWIYGLCGNKIFYDGIYPEGYHWTVYFLHKVFGFPIYTVLRVFFVVQIVSLCLMMFCFLKAVCKSRFIPYLSVIVYTGSSLFVWDSYSRLYASLPQEYGMIFMLPAVYFALSFFRQFAAEIKEKKTVPTRTVSEELSGKRRLLKKLTGKISDIFSPDSGKSLIFFAASVCLAMSTHFYCVIIIGTLCIGIAVGYCFRVFRWNYLKRIMCMGTAGILIAVAPMALCYVTGTPLQGSLNWAVDIIAGNDDEAPSVEEEAAEASGTVSGAGASGAGTVKKQVESSSQKWNKISARAEKYLSGEKNALNRYGISISKLYINSVVALILVCIIFIFILAEFDYGACLLAVGTGELLLLFMMCSDIIDIPTLMDPERVCVFSVYLLPVVWCLLLDAVVYLLSYLVMYVIYGHFKYVKAFSAASLAAMGCCVSSMTYFDVWRNAPQIIGLETNGAMICVENIIKTEADNSWTICSDPDELFMCVEHGFHYEIIRLLWENQESERITIPTAKIFFFIEKVPINYGGSGGGGIPISDEYAAAELPPLNSEAYRGTNRLVTMSRMDQWIRQFMRLHPYDVSVYYEDDEFICYELKQNTYSLYNLNIDYVPDKAGNEGGNIT